MDKPRASLDCVELYFYYKTGCQVLFVKKYDEYRAVGRQRVLTLRETPAKDDGEIGIKSGRGLGRQSPH